MKSVIFAVVMLFAFSANATNSCGNNGNNCGSNGGTTTANGGQGGNGGTGIGLAIAGASSAAEAKANAAAIAAQQQGQQQAAIAAQGQQQGIDRSGNSTNDITNVADGGKAQQSSANLNANRATTGSIIDNSKLKVDASTNTRAVAWAPVIHGPAAPALASANMVVTPTACGPRVDVIATPIEAHRFGVLFDSTFKNGVTHEVKPASEPFVERGGYLLGHQLLITQAVVGTSSAGSFSLGGYGKDGNGGQGGGSTSGGVQRLVNNIQVLDCIFAKKAE